MEEVEVRRKVPTNCNPLEMAGLLVQSASLLLTIPPQPLTGPFEVTINSRRLLNLLRPVEKSHVHGLAENMSLDRFHDCRASFECVRPRLDIDLRVQGKKFKGVMMARAAGGRAGSSIHGAARAELIGAVL